MFVRLLETQAKAPQRLMATVRLKNGEVQIEGEVPPQVREGIEYLRTLRPVDEEFFKLLVINYSGSWIRAQLVTE